MYDKVQHHGLARGKAEAAAPLPDGGEELDPVLERRGQDERLAEQTEIGAELAESGI